MPGPFDPSGLDTNISAEDVYDWYEVRGVVPVALHGVPDDRTTRANAVQAAINEAEDRGIDIVLVNEDYLNYDASAVNFSGSGGTWSGRMVREGQQSEGFSWVAYGAHPSNTGAGNVAAINAAVAGAKAQNGGRVFCEKPGTYDLDENGVNPYESGHRHCIDIDGDDITLALGAGVTLKLADDQQTDANGPVDIIVFQDRSGVSIVGAGSGASRITGNTAGQTNWTGGYAQTNNGNIIYGHTSTSTANRDVLVEGLTLDDHFSNACFIGETTSPDGDRVRCRDVYALDCGEGIHLKGAKGVRIDDCTVEDPSDVFVGDAFEVAECDDVVINGCTVRLNGSGAAFDIFGSKRVRVSDFEIDEWESGFTFQTTGGGRTTEGVVIENGTVRGLRNTNGAFNHAPVGPVTVSNVQVFGGTSTLWTLIEGPSTMERMRFVGCDFYVDGSTDVRSLKVRDGSRVSFIGCSFATDEDTAFGSCIVIQRTSASTPDVIVKACEFGGDLSTAAVTSDGGGNSFSPTGAITGCEFNGATPLKAQNSGDFSAMDMDPNVRIADADRPSAGIAGRLIFNTTDGNLNIDTGSDWILPDGTSAT